MQKLYGSNIQKVTMVDSTALFWPMSATPTLPSTDTKKTRYRVKVVMFWYGETGNQQGRAIHRVDWYGPDGAGQKGGCRAKLGF